MKLKKSLSRIAWRFRKGNFTPNQEDIDSLNEIIEYCDRKEKQAIIDNQLFGKLYAYLYGEFVNYYNATVVDVIPQKELNKLLGKDFRLIVEDVKDRLNVAELEYFIKNDKHKDYKPLEYEEVAENLRLMINSSIETFKNK